MKNILLPFFILCGLAIAAGLYKEDTNTILAFGFLMVSLVIVWGKK